MLFEKISRMENQHKLLIEELTKLLLGGSAHVSLQDALKDMDPKLRGVKPNNMPYSIWQLVDHIRIAQWDMLQFCKDADHKSPKWPDEYWPKESAPGNDDQWVGALKQINSDLDEFIELMEHSDIYQSLQHGDGQTILREALQIADHNAYHIGEVIAIRRILNDWK
ncbi:MAG: transporter [Mucilaginibacter sp.]|nr:transporter [Mucilaginibacter sp.]